MTLLERREAFDRGRQAEALVVADLEARGWTVRARNWRPPFPATGELDLVVERDGVVRFVEVKARDTADDAVLESLGRGQVVRLRRAAEAWLADGGPVREAAFLLALVTTGTEPWSVAYLDDPF